MHANSLRLFQKYVPPLIHRASRVLEIGPDAFPSTYQCVVNDDSVAWHTLDLYDDSRLTYVSSSEYVFPVPSCAYDFVISGQVIEHVKMPWVWMRELSRICRPGGCIITINPVSWPYHEAPVDCWRIFPDGMKALCADASLEVQLSVFESLEYPQFRNRIPGRSPECQDWMLRNVARALARFGFPVECSFDTITIAKKN